MTCCDVDKILPVHPVRSAAAPLEAPQVPEDSAREWCHEEDLAALVQGGDMEVVDTNLGTSGVYFVCEAGAPAGVFKPASQEHVPDEFKGALVEGENLYRERAAYVISQQLGGLCGVPATVIARITNPKLGGEQEGSLQRFVPHAVDMSDMGPGGISDDEVHKVGLLDLLLLNLDRHEGNMLMKEGDDGSKVLIPIDHGLCLPRLVTPTSPPDTELLHQLSFVWQGWKHACRPFSPGARALATSLSPRMTASLADAVAKDMPTIPRPALTTLKVGALTVRACVGAGMTLREVADFVLTGLGDALTAAWGAGASPRSDYTAWEGAFLARLEAAVRALIVGEAPQEEAEEGVDKCKAFGSLVSPTAVATCVASWTMQDVCLEQRRWGSTSSLAALLAPPAHDPRDDAREAGSLSPVRAAAGRRHHRAPAAASCEERGQHKPSKHLSSQRGRAAVSARASRRALRRGCRGGTGCSSSVSSCSSTGPAATGPSTTATALLHVASSGGVGMAASGHAAAPSPAAAMRRTAEWAEYVGAVPREALHSVWRTAARPPTALEV